MKKCIVLLTWCCCVLPFYVKAQKELRLISSRDYEARKEWGVNRFYKPVFLHEGSTLSADSSDYNPDDRFFDAFGNVVITQPNGTVVYADKLHYTYTETSRIAILTNNVKMVDAKGAVLTTNYLTYDLNAKRGTYTNGGRIVNDRDTLNSKTGYYFENSQDAFFRYQVVVRTPETNIFTDTLRYNSLSKMAYFYGPTNIKGKNGASNLYTENGDYHTESDRARFGKKNLYTEGSKFLKGDSLYYDGKQGYGRAIKNVVFIDTAQQGILYGQRGIYLKKDESITMTEKAYMILVTTNDSTKRDSAQNDTLKNGKEERRLKRDKNNRLQAKVDSLNADSTLQPDSLRTLTQPDSAAADSVYLSADTLYSRVILLKEYKPIALNLQRDGGDLDMEEELEAPPGGTDSLENLTDSLENPVDSLSEPDSTQMKLAEKKPMDIPDSLDRSKIDSLGRSEIDSLIKDQPLAISADSLIKMGVDIKPDSLQRVKEPSVDSVKKALMRTNKIRDDSLSRSPRDLIGLELKADSLMIDAIQIPLMGQADSAFSSAEHSALHPAPPARDTSVSDTAKTRIIKAYHHMRIFKSDLQARADSAYYGYPDSVLRCYGNPMIWAQGSQLSGDTVYMQMKNGKLDNMLLKTHAFIVSTQLDSVKFNQVKGRKITGFFTNNKLDRMFVDGNAESIYYTMEESKISGMTKSLGSRIKIIFDNNEVTDIINIRKTETNYTPVASFDPDKEILPGFIWKPKDRPKSKEEVINPPLLDTVATDSLQKTAADSSDSLRKTVPDSTVKKQPDQGMNNPIKKEEEQVEKKTSVTQVPQKSADQTAPAKQDTPVPKATTIPDSSDRKKEIPTPKK